MTIEGYIQQKNHCLTTEGLFHILSSFEPLIEQIQLISLEMLTQLHWKGLAIAASSGEGIPLVLVGNTSDRETNWMDKENSFEKKSLLEFLVKFHRKDIKTM